jgi:hypothetical protein
MKCKFFSYGYGFGVYGKCFWFRLYGYGLHFKKYNKNNLLFSERNGYTPYVVFFGIKVKILKP